MLKQKILIAGILILLIGFASSEYLVVNLEVEGDFDGEEAKFVGAPDYFYIADLEVNDFYLYDFGFENVFYEDDDSSDIIEVWFFKEGGWLEGYYYSPFFENSNLTSVFISVPYDENAESVRFFNNGRELLEIDLDLLCDFDGLCEEHENIYSCSDCSIEDEDGICGSESNDGICDVDCYLDYDCELFTDLNGKIQIAPEGADQSNNLEIEILYEGGNLEVRETSSDFEGNFVVENLLQGKIVDITIKPEFYLRKNMGFWSGFIFNEVYDFFDFGTAKAGDINDNNKVDFYDLGKFAHCWNKYTSSYPDCVKADFNRDGKIDFYELGPLSGNWGLTGATSLS